VDDHEPMFIDGENAKNEAALCKESALSMSNVDDEEDSSDEEIFIVDSNEIVIDQNSEKQTDGENAKNEAALCKESAMSMSNVDEEDLSDEEIVIVDSNEIVIDQNSERQIDGKNAKNGAALCKDSAINMCDFDDDEDSIDEEIIVVESIEATSDSESDGEDDMLWDDFDETKLYNGTNRTNC